MDLIKAVQELRLDRDDITVAIGGLERIVARTHDGSKSAKKRGRPLGSKNKKTLGWTGLLPALSPNAVATA